MSNPGVFNLSSLSNIGSNFRFDVEDNVGEAIHIHYKDIRLDLTINEFYKLAEFMNNMIDDVVNIQSFKSEEYDSIFLLKNVDKFQDLINITEDKIYLADLLVDCHDGNLKKIDQSYVFDVLNGNRNYSKQNSMTYYNHNTAILKTIAETVDYVFDEVIKEGLKNKKIILFNNSNCIVDGEKTAACLLHLYGNIEVCVKRFWFQDNKYSKYPVLELHDYHSDELKNKLDKKSKEVEKYKKFVTGNIFLKLDYLRVRILSHICIFNKQHYKEKKRFYRNMINGK